MTERARAWFCIIGALLIIPTVIFMQQYARYMTGETTAVVPRSVETDETAYDPGIAEVTIESKVLVKLLAEDGPGWCDPEVLVDLDAIALSRTDRVRAAIVAGHLVGPDAAMERLDVLSEEAQRGGSLLSDIEWLRVSYQESPDAIPSDARDALVDRHGWFGQLALAQGLSDDDPYRSDLISGGAGIFGFLLIWMGFDVLTGLGGLVALVVLVIMLVTGRITAVSRVTPGSMVLLETFGFYCAAMLLSVSATFVAALVSSTTASAGAFAVGEVMMWVGAASLFWPLFQFVGERWSWGQYREDIGLHAGAGIFREVGTGVLVWLAELPLLFIFALIITVLSDDGGLESGGEYPIFQFPFGNSWLVALIGVVGACVVAPVFEEIAFRGVLWRLIRSRLGAIGTIATTAVVFGAIHPYDWTGIVSVTVGGVIFGWLREWRGSLIAPMVSHFLHNASLTVFPLVFLLVLG